MPIPFSPIARFLTRRLHPAPVIDLSSVQDILLAMDQAKPGQGTLITVNHYSAPDFQAWWFVIVISAVIPANIHWVVTSGWTDSGWLTGFTHWLFPRGAYALGFTPMPAMPPNPEEAMQRALAMRAVLKYASRTPGGVIGMAPEGGDRPGGVLGKLYPGVGRFLHSISRTCPNIIPVGVWKEQGRIHVNFGRPYQLDIDPGLSTQELDQQVESQVMQRIAQLLPERLRGEFG